MKQLKEEIIENRKIAEGFHRMRVESAYLAKNTKPGQFFEVRCSDINEPLLRRPLGVHRILKNGVEMLYEVVGKGTELLSKKRAGEELDIIGPLGNGFTLPRNTHDARRMTILIAGGIGVAPLFALAEELVSSPQSMIHRKNMGHHALIGACKKEHILCEKEFKKLGYKVMVTTENGSCGKKGMITEPLKFLLSTMDCRLWTIYACGPTAMLKTVAQIAGARHIPCQVSLEERMACGVGACLGCPVKVKTQYAILNTQYEYRMVCKDGPVFNAEEVIL